MRCIFEQLRYKLVCSDAQTRNIQPNGDNSMNIAIISGTNRTDSMSLKVATKMQSLYDDLGAQTTLIDLKNLPNELFQPTVYKEKPSSFDPFQKAILEADGILFVVPEYNGSYPGILKYFIDMWKYPESFEFRCVAYIGVAAGQWGGLRSVEHLQGVMGYRNAFQFNERVFVNNIYKRWDYEAAKLKKLTEKEFDIEELLQTQSKNFLRYCTQIRGQREKGDQLS